MPPRNLPPAVLITDPDGTVRSASGAADVAFGRSVGQKCQALVAAVAADGSHVCTDTCINEAPRAPTRVKVRGRTYRMVCSEVGPQRIVVLERTEPDLEPHNRPSPREHEVLVLIAQGLTNARIARRLELSPFTVRTHVEHLLNKFGVRTRTEAVAKALQLGILTP